MNKWQAYLDRGTPDNPDTKDLCYADSLKELVEKLTTKPVMSFKDWAELHDGGCSITIWYGELPQ